MQLSDALDDYLADCHAKNLSPRTIEWYTQKLNEWAKASPPTLEENTPVKVRAYLAGLSGLADNTLHGYTQVIKVFLNWCEEEKLLPAGTGKRV